MDEEYDLENEEALLAGEDWEEDDILDEKAVLDDEEQLNQPVVETVTVSISQQIDEEPTKEDEESDEEENSRERSRFRQERVTNTNDIQTGIQKIKPQQMYQRNKRQVITRKTQSVPPSRIKQQQPQFKSNVNHRKVIEERKRPQSPVRAIGIPHKILINPHFKGRNAILEEKRESFVESIWRGQPVQETNYVPQQTTWHQQPQQQTVPPQQPFYHHPPLQMQQQHHHQHQPLQQHVYPFNEQHQSYNPPPPLQQDFSHPPPPMVNMNQPPPPPMIQQTTPYQTSVIAITQTPPTIISMQPYQQAPVRLAPPEPIYRSEPQYESQHPNNYYTEYPPAHNEPPPNNMFHARPPRPNFPPNHFPARPPMRPPQAFNRMPQRMTLPPQPQRMPPRPLMHPQQLPPQRNLPPRMPVAHFPPQQQPQPSFYHDNTPVIRVPPQQQEINMWEPQQQFRPHVPQLHHQQQVHVRFQKSPEKNVHHHQQQQQQRFHKPTQRPIQKKITNKKFLQTKKRQENTRSVNTVVAVLPEKSKTAEELEIEEYQKRVEEQKRKREEFLRDKEKRRKEQAAERLKALEIRKNTDSNVKLDEGVVLKKIVNVSTSAEKSDNSTVNKEPPKVTRTVVLGKKLESRKSELKEGKFTVILEGIPNVNMKQVESMCTGYQFNDIQILTSDNKAIINFTDIQSAKLFCNKYNRKLLNMSVVVATLSD